MVINEEEKAGRIDDYLDYENLTADGRPSTNIDKAIGPTELVERGLLDPSRVNPDGGGFLPPDKMFDVETGKVVDIAAGGSVPDSVEEETAAAADANSPENQETRHDKRHGGASDEMIVSGTRSFPKLRGFTDQTFLLLHLANLVNIRNEKMEMMGFEGSEDVVMPVLNKIKAPLPKAYSSALSEDEFKGKTGNISTNATIQCYGDPYTFLNYMTGIPAYENYMNMKNEDLSKLNTEIRLFKVFHENEKRQAVEIPFTTSGISAQSVEELMKNGAKRGYGIGIKSFNITLDGTNPYTRKRSISATLVIHADSMETLLKPRTGLVPNQNGDPEYLHYRYTDLAMKTDTVPGNNGGKDTDGSFGSLNDLDYQIIAEVGVTDGKNLSFLAGLNKTGTSMSLSLGPVNHVYEIGQDGTIVLSIEYKGHIEKDLANPVDYDVFADVDSQVDDLILQVGSNYLTHTCGKEATKNFNKIILHRGNARLRKRVSSLMTDFIRSGKVYYIKIPEDVIQSYNAAFNSFEKVMKETNADADSNLKSDEPTATDKIRIQKAFENLHKALGKMSDIGGGEPSYRVGENSLGIRSAEKLSEAKAKELETAMSDEEDSENKAAISVCAVDPNTTQVAYFYAGDLINLILQRLSHIYRPDTTDQIVKAALASLEESDAFKELRNAESTALFGAAEEAFNSRVHDASLANVWNPDREQRILEATNDAALQVAAAQKHLLGKMEVSQITENDIISKYRAKGEAFSKFRTVLGPTMVSDFFTGNPIMCSIGDIPVPMTHFTSWLSKMVEGEGKYRVGLADFLNKFINTYLRTMLMGDKKMDQGVLGQTKSYNSTPLIAYNPTTTEIQTDYLTILRSAFGGQRRGLQYERVPQDYRPLLDTRGNKITAKSQREAYDYLVFYDKTEPPISRMLNAKKVAKQSLPQFGISMYQHGRDRGILKTAEYQATNIKGRKEARHQAGKFNGLEQLTEVFDVTLTTFADLQKFPGHKIYLDDQSLVPYLSKETLDSLHGYNLTDFGIGGFYIINNVSHSFEQGRFETTLRAQWEQYQKNKPKRKSLEQLKYDEVLQELEKPIQQACKNVAQPQSAASSELFDKIEDIAEGLFGGDLTDRIIGYVKGLFDSSDDSDSEWMNAGSGLLQAAQQSVTSQDTYQSPETATSSDSAHNGPVEKISTYAGTATATFNEGT